MAKKCTVIYDKGTGAIVSFQDAGAVLGGLNPEYALLECLCDCSEQNISQLTGTKARNTRDQIEANINAATTIAALKAALLDVLGMV